MNQRFLSGCPVSLLQVPASRYGSAGLFEDASPWIRLSVRLLYYRIESGVSVEDIILLDPFLAVLTTLPQDTSPGSICLYNYSSPTLNLACPWKA